jgi:hypothetical protein
VTQPGPDAQQYLKGAVWTMQMYIQGRCPDYRYTYTGSSPAPAEILEVRSSPTCAQLYLYLCLCLCLCLVAWDNHLVSVPTRL